MGVRTITGRAGRPETEGRGFSPGTGPLRWEREGEGFNLAAFLFNREVLVRNGWLFWGGLALFLGACGHGSSTAREQSNVARFERDEPDDGVRVKGSTVVTRIQVLIGQGQFAEAEALIAESSASGLLSKPQAARLLERIAQLNTRLGDIPAPRPN
jgi:hypothetical protein